MTIYKGVAIHLHKQNGEIIAQGNPVKNANDITLAESDKSAQDAIRKAKVYIDEYFEYHSNFK